MSAIIPFTVHVENTAYTLDGGPALFATIVALASVAIGVSILRRELGGGRAYLLALGALVTSLIGGSLWLAQTASASLSYLFRETTWDYVVRLFFVPLLAEHVALILAVLVAIAGVRALLREPPDSRSRKLAICGIIMAPLAGLTMLHAIQVEALLLLPRGVIKGPPHLHVGKRRHVRPNLAYSDGSKYDQNDYVVSSSIAELVGDTPGRREIIVSALNPHISFESKVVVTVAEDRPGGLFPLRSDEEQRYAGDQSCTFESGKSESKRVEYSFKIAAAEERDGLSMFQVEVSRGASFTAYNADGQSYWIPEDLEKKAVQPIVIWDRNSGSSCKLAPLDAKATCRANPDRIDALSLTGGTSGAGQVVMGILTLGIFVPEKSTCTVNLSRVTSPSPSK